jgi:DNA-directed RNA polymerase specialized sigma24 family protein
LAPTSDVVAAPAGEVWDLVRSLPTRQRTAVVLRYVGDLREDDIAAVMGVTRGTVAATLATARRNLANVLDDIEVERSS